MAQIAILTATSGNNLKLAGKLERVAKSLGADVVLINLEDLELPLYTPLKEEEGVPKNARRLTEALIKSGGMIWLAPEYNGSLPPIVNNAIAWVSRSGQDWREAFNNKFSIVGTHSGGGGLKVCQAMRQQLEHIGCNVLARNILTNNQKEFNAESAEAILKALIRLAVNRFHEVE